MIHVEGLVVEKNGAPICKAPELRVECGERVGIEGANGSGKSTVLRVLAGLETAFDGICRVDAPMRQRVYVHQNPYMFRGTALGNVEYGLRARGLRRTAREELAHTWMEKAGIAALARRRVDHLSGGERRRVALVRALALEPALLLLDEPFAEVDAQGIEVAARMIADLQHTTVLVASPTALPDQVVSRRYTVVRPARAPRHS